MFPQAPSTTPTTAVLSPCLYTAKTSSQAPRDALSCHLHAWKSSSDAVKGSQGHQSTKNMEPGLETRFWVPRPQKGDRSGQDDGESAGSFRSVTFASTGKRKAIPHRSPFQQLKRGSFQTELWWLITTMRGRKESFPLLSAYGSSMWNHQLVP